MDGLGKLEKVDLRKAWSSESSDFTPWLAQQENLALLGDTIGIDDIELEGQEKDVGPFRADIVCKDTTNDSLILIENQLERTDHSHLGQLLTYASGLNAVTIVWIAEKFTDEHRAALDWLNDITDDKFNFIGLEIELWKIGDSRMAPKFNIVSKPNDWSRTTTKAAKGNTTPIKQLQFEYWTEFKKYLEERRSFLKPQKASPQHWLNMTIGKSHFHLTSFVDTWGKKVSVGLILTGPNAKPHFHLLEEQKKDVENVIGEKLLWRELPNKNSSQIMLRFLDTDPTQKSQWPKQHKILQETLEKFYAAFSNRVKNINANDYIEDREESLD